MKVGDVVTVVSCNSICFEKGENALVRVLGSRGIQIADSLGDDWTLAEWVTADEIILFDESSQHIVFKQGDLFEYKGNHYVFEKYLKIKIKSDWIEGIYYRDRYGTNGDYVRTKGDFELKFKSINN